MVIYFPCCQSCEHWIPGHGCETIISKLGNTPCDKYIAKRHEKEFK